jgi:hypothetical protein
MTFLLDAAVPFDVVQLVVQGGAAGVLVILGWKALSLLQSLLTTQLSGLSKDVRSLTRTAEKMTDRLDLLLTATVLAAPIAKATTATEKAEQLVKAKEDVATVVEQTGIIKENGGSGEDHQS